MCNPHPRPPAPPRRYGVGGNPEVTAPFSTHGGLVSFGTARRLASVCTTMDRGAVNILSFECGARYERAHVVVDIASRKKRGLVARSPRRRRRSLRVTAPAARRRPPPVRQTRAEARVEAAKEARRRGRGRPAAEHRPVVARRQRRAHREGRVAARTAWRGAFDTRYAKWSLRHRCRKTRRTAAYPCSAPLRAVGRYRGAHCVRPRSPPCKGRPFGFGGVGGMFR